MTDKRKSDVVVAGGGPTGMAACLEAAAHGFDVFHVAPSGTFTDDDQRTTAIMMPGVKMLKDFGVWEALENRIAPLATLRMVDDTGRLLRAPTVEFEASEIGEAAFGYNFRNGDLNAALSQAVEAEPRITVIDAMVSAAGFGSDAAILTLSDGTNLEARLVVGADGIQSLIRQAADIDARSWSYPQTALVMTFAHSRPHNDVSTEFHTSKGPFTQVPLPGDNSSLVWVVAPEDVDDIMAYDQDTLSLEVERHLHSTLGKVTVTSKPQAWPLSSLVAQKFGVERAVLIGQAAHAFPPIGAQGLNLGLRDVEDLSKALANANGDPGSKAVTGRYDRMRRADVLVRTASVDALNRSLLTGFLPVQAVRALGLGALKAIAPLRAFAMREGMAPGSGMRAMAEALRPQNPFSRETDRPARGRSSLQREAQSR